MIEGTMAVRSNLRVILSERNTARIRAGLEPVTVRQLAKDMNLSPSVITGLTSGRAKQVSFETLDKLCKELECTPGDILRFVPESE